MPATNIKAVVSSGTNLRAKTVAIAPRQSLLDLTDVNPSGLADGAVLLYDAATQQFLVKNEMDKATTKIIGGHY
ncbi:MAG: hypothetical protein CMB73_03160 [Euryarchaeota archaeon]|nr:hypothetical protein [Euryarchaeota archaeon]|tara:strand:- start:2628 stop:2849 length:222 start_codon:yes stop_codon:yes gene_type:complete